MDFCKILYKSRGFCLELQNRQEFINRIIIRKDIDGLTKIILYINPGLNGIIILAFDTIKNKLSDDLKTELWWHDIY